MPYNQSMAFTIRDKDVERLVEEVARLTGESRAEAVRKALEMRLAELKPRHDLQNLLRTLEDKIWSKIPPEYLDKPLSQEETERLLGYGPKGF